MNPLAFLNKIIDLGIGMQVDVGLFLGGTHQYCKQTTTMDVVVGKSIFLNSGSTER